MDFKKYIVSFTGEKISNPVPGEHHFVGLCLLKLLMDNIGDVGRIKYVNPDGSKNSKPENHSVLYDISIKGSKDESLSGIEVKYSKGYSIKYTASQLDHLYPEIAGGNRKAVDGFIGFVAIVNVKGKKGCQILFISAEHFLDHFKEDFEKIVKLEHIKNEKKLYKYNPKYISKTCFLEIDDKPLSGWVPIETVKQYLELFDLT